MSEEFISGIEVLIWAFRTGKFDLMVPEEWNAAGHDGNEACIAQQLFAEMEYFE